MFKFLAIRNETDLHHDSTKQTMNKTFRWRISEEKINMVKIHRELMEGLLCSAQLQTHRTGQIWELYNLFFSFVFFRSPWLTKIKLYFFCFASCKINNNNQLKLVLCQQAIVCDNNAGRWKKIALFPWPPQSTDKYSACSIYNLKPQPCPWVGF